MSEDFSYLKRFLNVIGRLCKKTYRKTDDTYADWKYAYFFFYQRCLLFNVHVPWPCHHTSFVTSPSRVKFGRYTSPGSAPCQYIQGDNGIEIGDNVQIAPGVHIISANHDPSDYSKLLAAPPVRIGNNVWIGGNAVILPGVQIGSNVIIGAGSVVTRNIPDDSVAVGNPCRVIKKKEKYREDSVFAKT